MNRAIGGGMRGYPRGGGGGGGGSIRSRLGVPAGGAGGLGGGGGRRNVRGGGRGGGGGGIQGRLGGGVKARLGIKPGGGGVGIRARRSVAAVALGEIRDARQKINMGRIQSGRIGDARQKIEERRRKQAIIDGKIKNLRMVAPVVEQHLQRNPFRGGLVSRSERQAQAMMVFGGGGGGGGFRSGGGGGIAVAAFSPIMPTRITRSAVSVVGGGGGAYMGGMRIAPPSREDIVLTRTIRNATPGYGGGMRSDYIGRSPGGGVVRVAPNMHYGSHGSPMDMEMDEDEYVMPAPSRRQEYPIPSDYCRILVSNLQPSVTADDIIELFSDIGPLVAARISASGQAEVTYSRKSDAMKAIEAYHNRLLDGSAMRVFLDSSSSSQVRVASASSHRVGSYTALKSASGASMKLPAGKASSSLKIQPDIQAIHKVLFNPGSSGTRGLFKGGQ